MKNRDKQRQNRKRKEEMLNIKNEYGNYDPTPYEAVKNIIQENYKNRKGGNKKPGIGLFCLVCSVPLYGRRIIIVIIFGTVPGG